MVDNLLKIRLQQYLKQYGDHCMAYSTLQDEMKYFVDDKLGYIAYQSFWHPILAPFGRQLVLSDPVAAKESFKPLVELFLKRHKNVIFVQINEEMAQVLSDLGLLVNQFGIETYLSIKDYETKGKYKAQLRQWFNRCQREKIMCTESYLSESDVMEMRAISKQWIEKKGGSENAFLTRPMIYQAEPDVRYFLARSYSSTGKTGQLLAFSVFDPMYKSGQVVGYYHNADRIAPISPNGIGAFLVLNALNQFKKENKQILSLGMSPLYNIKETYNHHAFTSKALKFAYKNLNRLYPFKGNASHKKKFGGERSKVYIASSKGMNLRELLVMLKALKLI